MGVNATIARKISKEYGKKMRETLANYVQQCKMCQICKSSKHKLFGLLHAVEPLQEKRTHITMDFMKPRPRSKKGNRGVLVVLDRLPKMTQAFSFSKDFLAPEAT